MNVVKKVVAVLVMVLSAVLLLVMLAGVAGTWWGQGQLKGGVTQLSNAADTALARAGTTVSQVDTAVQNTQGRVDGLVTNVTAAGTKVEETKLALVAAEKLLDTDLTPTVQGVQDRVSELRATVSLIEQSLSLMRWLPGGRDNQLLATADTAITKLKELDQAVQDFRASVQGAKSQATAAAVNALTSPLNRVSERLATVSSNLAALNQRIAAEQAQLAALTAQMLNLITIGAIVLTLAFVWMALAQLALFVHAYGIFTGRDPLARWHKRKANADTAPVAQATPVA